MKKWKYLWLAWGGLIVILSVVPSSALPKVGISDKILHAAFFVPMTFMPAVAFKRGKRASLGIIGLALFVLGALLEVIQNYVPGRYFSYADMIANGVGLAAGLLLGLAWNRVASTANRRRPSLRLPKEI